MSSTNRGLSGSNASSVDYEGYFISEQNCCFRSKTSYVVLQNRCIAIYPNQSEYKNKGIPTRVLNVSELTVFIEDRWIVFKHKKEQQVQLIALNDEESHLFKRKINAVIHQDWLARYKNIDKSTLFQLAQDPTHFYI